MGQEASKRRVEAGEKAQLLDTENRVAVKLSASKIKNLKQLYRRLASLSPDDEYIDKQTFLNYFPLEGILAERLFATFDKDKNNVIDYEEFLGGLALCLSGTVDEKFQLVFDLYNIDDGDGVCEEELAIVLKSTFMAASAMLKVHEIMIVNPMTNTLLGYDGNSFNIDEHVRNIVNDAFEQCDTSQTGKLSPEEFRTWAERHSYILDIIFGHKSFTDKQQISENITAATIKAVELNSLKYPPQTWLDSPTNSEQLDGSIHGYSKATYLWSPVFPVMLKAPKARSDHTVCVYQGVLYLLGGRGRTAYKDFWKYDLALNNWSEIETTGECPSLIFGHTAVVHKGSMYVYGGEFKSCETLVWEYTFNSNVWQRISPNTTSNKSIPQNRRHHSAVRYDNKMYVFGGIIDIRGCTDELWSFTFVNHEWKLILQAPKNNPGARYEHSALVHNKIMWITGGLANYQAKSDVWKWDFEKFSWTKIKSRGGPFPIHGHRAVKCCGAMVVFGGTINSEYNNMIWRFDFDNQSWSTITPHGNVSPSARSAPAVLTLSAFSLPLLPPQMVQSKSSSVLQNWVEEVRPRSSPEFKSRQNAIVPRSRYLSCSTSSLYQPPFPLKKQSSVGSTYDLDESTVVSFTNASYRHSIEGPHFPHCESSVDHQDQTGKKDDIPPWNVQKKEENISDVKRLEPHPKEGLCLFLVGGKCCAGQYDFTKGVDIWRCDVTKQIIYNCCDDSHLQPWGVAIAKYGREFEQVGHALGLMPHCPPGHKRRDKVTKIKVKSAETAEWSGFSPKPEELIPKEQLTCGNNSPSSQSRKEVVLTVHQDVFKISDRSNKARTCHGDLVVTDLLSSDDNYLQK